MQTGLRSAVLLPHSSHESDLRFGLSPRDRMSEWSRVQSPFGLLIQFFLNWWWNEGHKVYLKVLYQFLIVEQGGRKVVSSGLGDDDDDDDGSDTEEEDDVEVADAQFGKNLDVRKLTRNDLFFKKCNFVQSATLMTMTVGMTMATMMTMTIKIVRFRSFHTVFSFIHLSWPIRCRSWMWQWCWLECQWWSKL